MRDLGAMQPTQTRNLTARLRAAWPGLLLNGFLPAAVYLGVSLLFGRAWLGDELPTGDFGGNAAYLWFLERSLATEWVWPAWSEYWFCGEPMSLLRVGILGALAWFLPFALVWDTITALKIGCLVYFALSGLMMYFLVKSLTRSRPAAWLGGLAYTLHPVHLSVTAGTGHPNFPPMYVLAPLLLLCVVRLARRVTYGRIVTLSVVLGMMAVTEVERMVTCLVPVLVGGLLYARLVQEGDREDHARGFWRFTGALAVASGLAVVLAAGIMGPAFLESEYYTLFSPEVRAQSVEYFSLQNPLHLVDRAGVLVGRWKEHLPSEFTYNAGNLYLSLSLLGLATVGLALAEAGELRRLGVVGVTISVASVWIAGGMYSIYDRLCALGAALYRSQRYLDSKSLEVPLLVFVTLAAIAGVSVWRAWLRHREESVPATYPSAKTLLLLAGAAAFLFVPPKALFLYAPFLSHMRSPSWFMSFAPSLGVCLAAALVPAVLRARGWRSGAVAAVTLGAGFLYLVDVAPYQKTFQAVEKPEVYEDLKKVAGFLAEARAKEGPFRVLSRETYNPRFDTQIIWSGVPQAWSWLNWASPRDLGRLFLREVYPKLHRRETVDEACRLAGGVGVKYLVCDLTAGPVAPATRNLDPVLHTQSFLVYRNRLFRPLVGLLKDATEEDLGALRDSETDSGLIWRLERPNQREVVVRATVPEDGTLRLAQSWHPGWQVEVDGDATELVRFRSGFMGAGVTRGRHDVRFFYRQPGYYALGWIASAWGLLGVVALARRSLRLRLLETVLVSAALLRPRFRNLAPRLGCSFGRLERVGFVLLILTAAFLRLDRLHATPRWFADEGQHVMIAGSLWEGSPRMQAMRLSWLDAYHPYPPGFDVAVLAMMGLIGKSILAPRLVAGLAAVATVGVVFLIGRRLGGRLAGWTAGLALAVHPLSVVFHRWGFTATAAGFGAALTFLLALRIREQPTPRRVMAALAASVLAVAASYWTASVFLFVAYVVLTSDRNLALRCAAYAAWATLALVCLLAATGMLQTTAARLAGIGGVVLASQGGEWSGISSAVRSTVSALGHYLTIDVFITLGTMGLFLAPKGWTRRDLLLGFALLAAVPILLRADIMGRFFYNALIFVPLVFVGFGCFAARAAGLLSLMGEHLARFDRRALVTLAAGSALAVIALLSVRTTVANHRGWQMRIDGFCEQDPEAARSVATWIDARTSDDQWVIASHPSGWLLQSRSAHVLHATARAGIPTTWFLGPTAPDRFAFDCSLEKARFLWVEQTLRHWAAFQPGVAGVLFDAEIEGWPLVYRRGVHEVYANPRTWEGPVLDPKPTLVGVSELYRRLGNDFLANGDNAMALATYERLALMEPHSADARNNAAVAAARLEQWDKARGLWAQALQFDPESLAARHGLAQLATREEADQAEDEKDSADQPETNHPTEFEVPLDAHDPTR